MGHRDRSQDSRTDIQPARRECGDPPPLLCCSLARGGGHGRGGGECALARPSADSLSGRLRVGFACRGPCAALRKWGGETGRRGSDWSDAVAKGECVSSRVLVWCLLAPSRGGVLLLGGTRSAVLTLGDPCLL